MSRTNIFELLEQNNTIKRDSIRLRRLLTEFDFVSLGMRDYTLLSFFDDICFDAWNGRKRCIDLEDFFDSLGIDDIDDYETDNLDEFISFCEIILNFWHLSDDVIRGTAYQFEVKTAYEELKRMTDECLSELNYVGYYQREKDRCIVVEKSPQVTAAAEASEPELAWEIVRYNHRDLAGDVAKKKAILKVLGDELEGRKAEITSINAPLYNNITGALNNLNIRHNNVNPDNKSTYKKAVAEMPEKELEQHYDDLYQLILLAILEMDNVDRQRAMRELVQRINDRER